MRAQEAVILGTAGPTGAHLAAALNRRSIQDRASLRDLQNLDKSFVVSQEGPAAIDGLDPDALANAIRGHDIVYDCLTPLSADFSRQPLMARNLAIAAAKTGARIIHVSNYTSYLPVSYLPLDEDHPRAGDRDRSRYRREAEDSLLAAGAAVIHLPDFYGPLVHGGLVQRAIEDAYSGGMIRWLGPAEIDREYSFVPDAMEAVVRLSYCPEAFGQRWIIGGNGPLSAKTLASIVGKKLNRAVRISSPGSFALRLQALYDGRARASLRLLPELSKPISFDSSKLESVTGPIATVSHEQGITRTLEWLERRRLVK
jgi:nucleoside-diphosphate-sugar epimerase